MNYFVAVNGESTGPYTLDDLKSANLSPDTLIWYEGLKSWVPASSVEELKLCFSNQPPQMPGTTPAFGQHSPQGEVRAVYDECPPVRLGLAIFSAIMFPTGIAAIVKAALVRPRWNAGRYADAEYLSRSSKNFAITAIIIGAVFWTMYLSFLTSL